MRGAGGRRGTPGNARLPREDIPAPSCSFTHPSFSRCSLGHGHPNREDRPEGQAVGRRGERSVTEPAESGRAPRRRRDEGRGKGHSWRREPSVLRQWDTRELVCWGSRAGGSGEREAAGEARETAGRLLPCRRWSVLRTDGHGRALVVIHGGPSTPRS